jgi:primosomal protein N'
MGKITSSRTARRQTANGAGTPIEKRLAEARRKLIETRNRLIHAPRGAKRSRALSPAIRASPPPQRARPVPHGLLLPVSLVRDAKRSTFDLKLRDDGIATNQALQERLRGDFGLALPEVVKSEDWQPSSYFDAVANAVAAKRRWSIDANAIELGFYSFAKQLMMRDLEPGNWPDNALAAHPLLRRLLGEGFATEPPIPPEAARLDEVLKPADLIHVVAADSSQTRIVEAVRAGHNLVVQGPPGTGKSQTITNIIAAAVHDGQTVLFIAEKVAALNAVYDRLDKSGLDDICLELHSWAANKRLVAERLDRTLLAAVDHLRRTRRQGN